MMWGSLAKITFPFFVLAPPITQLLLPIKAGTGDVSNNAETAFAISAYSMLFPLKDFNCLVPNSPLMPKS